MAKAPQRERSTSGAGAVPRGLAVIRIIAVLASGALALWIAVGVTLNFTVARQMPALTRAWWPAGILTKVAEGRSVLTTAPTLPAARNDQARRMLRDAALREPVNTQALGILAGLEEYRGDKARARTLFRLSEAVSRRNALTQFWLIEDAVAQGDIAAAIRHYDRAMRVSVDSRATLLPVLLPAASDPAILANLLPVLAQRPLWWKDYARRLATSDSPSVIGASLRALRLDPGDHEERVLAGNILRRMVALDDEQGAITAANRLEGRAAMTRSLSDGNFEGGEGLLPFTWWLRDEGSLRAYRDGVPNGSTGLRITTSAGASGGVAQQLVGLAPGRYAVQGVAGDVSTDTTARPAIEIRCGKGTAISQTMLPASREEGERFRFMVDVPHQNCATQWITLVTAPAVDTDIWIDDLAITR